MDVKVDRAQPSPMIEATLVVLAGGRSRRMQSPKALLPVAGTTLLEWLVARLAPGFRQSLVAAATPDQVPPGLRDRLVLDRRPGSGPLAGLEAGLRAADCEIVFLLACDLPNTTAELARTLVGRLPGHQAAVPVAAGRFQPTAAAYDRSALAAVEAMLDRGQHRVTELLSRLDVAYLERTDLETFRNLNTPADYQAFLRLTHN
jgi:molybdopterin-guanine dinucleotide biosynthesis protein A